MPCECCPFNDGLNEEATTIQNLGCLPTPGDMIQMAQNQRVAMSCHENDAKRCAGLCRAHPPARKLPILAYTKWYHGE